MPPKEALEEVNPNSLPRNIRWKGKWFDNDGACKSDADFERITLHEPVLLSHEDAALAATGQLPAEKRPPRMKEIVFFQKRTKTPSGTDFEVYRASQ